MQLLCIIIMYISVITVFNYTIIYRYRNYNY